MITDLGNLAGRAVDYIYQPLTCLGFLDHTVNRDTDHELRPFLIGVSVVTTITTMVPMSLDQVTGSGTRAGANQGTSPPTDQCTAKQPYASSDKCSLASTVMWTTVIASLRAYIDSSECSH